MMKKSGVFLLAAILLMSPLARPASARPDVRGDNSVTQGELALMLVNVLGLYRYLPPAPGAHNAIEILVVNQIAPVDGWELEKVVTRADLARIITLALDRGDEVADPDDPQSWVDFLVGIGIPIDTVGVALENVEPMGEPVAPYLLAASATTDPLKQQTIYGQPDEVAFGTDMTFIVSMRELVQLIPLVDVPPPRIPVTPD